jgi:hypothetical protein
MNANTRKARQILRDRARTNRAASRLARNGSATLATHAAAQGLTTREARSVAGSLRTAAKKLAITGSEIRVHAGRHMRDARAFTPAQVALIVTAYRPRKAEYKTVAARLALAA